jgi:segregation and condensation protein B
MERKDIESAIEGILFASGEPVKGERLAQAIGVEPIQVDTITQQLSDRYRYERRGIRILRVGNGWQMCSAPENAAVIRRALERRKPPQLTPSALEVLSVIAYYQPTTRAYVDQIRGVDSAYTMTLLLERGLIEECGRLSVPGRPTLFRTTQAFLRSFGLESLDDLPPLPESSSEEGNVPAEEEGS